MHGQDLADSQGGARAAGAPKQVQVRWGSSTTTTAPSVLSGIRTGVEVWNDTSASRVIAG